MSASMCRELYVHTCAEDDDELVASVQRIRAESSVTQRPNARKEDIQMKILQVDPDRSAKEPAN